MISRIKLKPYLPLCMNDFILYSFKKVSTYTTSGIKTFFVPTLLVKYNPSNHSKSPNKVRHRKDSMR